MWVRQECSRHMEPARLNGMKLIFKTLAAGLFAFSMANAQDDVPADAALAPASDKPTMARSELPVGADISNRYLERVFYHWKDNKEKGIIKVFIHTDELAEEREPDVLNYDVLYRDADNNVIFWKDHVAKCVKCFGKPVVDGPTPILRRLSCMTGIRRRLMILPRRCSKASCRLKST